MFKIDKKSEIPLYQQLAHSIKKAVDEQKLKENDKIPAENEFCKIYDLSRTTVRQALDILEKDGYIYKLRGKGSYVSTPKIYQNRSSFSKFYDDMRSLGKVPVSKIISLKIKVADAYVREKMQLEENEMLCQIKWIRYGNNEPLIYETINLNYKLVDGIEMKELTDKKLYDILSEEYGIKMTHGKELFYPCKLDINEAKNLGLKENDLGMKVERVVFQGKDVVEYTTSTVRGDRFIYTTNF
ncbi:MULTISPECIES: GntR family transcriptional regulator [Fusobacterium]|uniref:GntR family transcriptional regulator n=2 Tax=Fusobacterium mortiferum TaxID=850 RepID=A0A414PZE9_FUSMR|nr:MULTISPECIES: GntR family transcriptional regulator [Fusobacterium]AVQ18411.1 GntR family transcriptional regulator [Fusobacterium mortiferum ATCC 9817]EEO34647.1 UbiC transcription regulator-associated domain protein [Fusobacterium mortiferum ATCC 9817]MCF2626509.1 GntR family transcriptional regulator [Fusobacterium mortiferum]MCF2699575.1 GntR family transcriptional regulator [Fusobacterium mortiferum]MCI6381692.1 GntR family transcriptional regulator [Fusobacterium mortiferum]